jgi:hypothetical protein
LPNNHAVVHGPLAVQRRVLKGLEKKGRWPALSSCCCWWFIQMLWRTSRITYAKEDPNRPGGLFLPLRGFFRA